MPNPLGVLLTVLLPVVDPMLLAPLAPTPIASELPQSNPGPQ